MTLRRRVAVRTTVVMVVAVALVLVVARQIASTALLDAIDDDLAALGEVAPTALGDGAEGSSGGTGQGPGRGRSLNELRRLVPPGSRRMAARLGVDGPLQVLAADGSVATSGSEVVLPVSPTAAAVARGEAGPSLETVEVDGGSWRVLTRPLPRGGAVQLGRSLAEVEATLSQLTIRLLLVAGVLATLAAAASLLVADRLTRPVSALTAAAEHVARTQQLDTRIAPEGDDELARLGRSFDHMLGRLEEARAAQTQLIADASHELRTPLTSLRTNIDLLRSGAMLGTADHGRLLSDLDDQLTEFGHLVDGLVELARGEQAPREPVAIHLDALAGEVVDAARRDHPGSNITVQAVPTVVAGEERRLTRALRALVDNAVLHGGGDVEVVVSGDRAQAQIAVRDHGPGIADEDREHVFERFYRSPAARGRPGSGLGLAVAEQAARTHGGTIVVQGTPGGGTTVVLQLPADSEPVQPTGHGDGWG